MWPEEGLGADIPGSRCPSVLLYHVPLSKGFDPGKEGQERLTSRALDQIGCRVP